MNVAGDKGGAEGLTHCHSDRRHSQPLSPRCKSQSPEEAPPASVGGMPPTELIWESCR
jgi:hypothetical protein